MGGDVYGGKGKGGDGCVDGRVRGEVVWGVVGIGEGFREGWGVGWFCCLGVDGGGYGEIGEGEGYGKKV